jgi:hypothetical protein
MLDEHGQTSRCVGPPPKGGVPALNHPLTVAADWTRTRTIAASAGSGTLGDGVATTGGACPA